MDILTEISAKVQEWELYGSYIDRKDAIYHAGLFLVNSRGTKVIPLFNHFAVFYWNSF